jgi:hypothetical protein
MDYLQSLWRRQKHSEKWHTGDQFLHYNNAPSYSMSVQESLVWNHMTVYFPYNPYDSTAQKQD